MLSVMNALGSLRGTTVSAVMGFINHYERVLMDRGIDPGLFLSLYNCDQSFIA